jgi:hypothetical protein
VNVDYRCGGNRRGLTGAITRRYVSQKTCPRGERLISDCGSGSSHGVQGVKAERSSCLRPRAEIS